MPLYEYRCSLCDNQFEESDPMSESSLPRKCPNCPDGMGRRIFSTSNFTFKNLSKGHNLGVQKRRELFNSKDPKEFREIM